MKRTPLKRSTKPLKRTPIKKKSKSKSSTLKRKAWSLFSRYIRARDKNVCFTCGGRGTQGGHFRHSAGATYFDERNVHAQCTYCNLHLHGNLGVYAVNLDKRYGLGTAEELIKKSQEIYQRTTKEYEEIISTYTEKIKHL